MKFEKKQKKAIIVRISPELVANLRRISKKYSKPGNYVSINEIVEKAIEELIKQDAPKRH
jgi:predicted DNA-binding protein